jgi:hypothetical protein
MNVLANLQKTPKVDQRGNGHWRNEYFEVCALPKLVLLQAGLRMGQGMRLYSSRDRQSGIRVASEMCQRGI